MDERVHRDIHRLSTGDLVVCWTVLSQMAEYARASGALEMAREYHERLRAIDSEIESRQQRLPGLE